MKMLVKFVFVALVAGLFVAGINCIPPGSGRITGGEDANLGDYPYQVVIYLKNAEGKSAICGGSILSNYWILTAAHCTENRVNARVVVGRIYLKDHHQGTSFLVTNESDIVTHPKFKKRGFHNDIALIKLPSAIEYGDNVKAVDLAINSNETYIGDVVTATGFGKLGDNEDSSDYLQHVDLDVLSLDECKKYYPRNHIDNTKLCVSGYDEKSTCKGDSGGPIVLSSTQTQIGLTSFSRKQCQEGFPTVFTRINAHKHFIESTTGLTFN